MKVHNTWVLNVIQNMVNCGLVRSLSRTGFIEEGRGAIAVEIDFLGQQSVRYLSGISWKLSGLDEPRKIAVLEAIETYKPLSQAVVVAISPLGNRVEVTTCLIELRSD